MIKYIAGVGLAVLVLTVAGLFFWFNVAREEAPPPLSLPETTVAEESSGTDPTEEVNLAGNWIVDSESVAGYRVVEDIQFKGLKDFEAVGRTSTITGFIVLDEDQLIEADFEIDVASIKSDDSRRDKKFTDEIMDADKFPTARFTLTEPVSFPAGTTSLSPNTEATGELTLKDVTKIVTFPIEGQINDKKEIEIAATIDINFSDYGIDNPSNSAIKVRDNGLIEAQLKFKKQ